MGVFSPLLSECYSSSANYDYYNNGSCYRNGVGTNSWTNSNKNCENTGGHLVHIETATEQAFVESLGHAMWIGLRRPSTSSTETKWVPGNIAPFYTNYHPTVPDKWTCYQLTNSGLWEIKHCADKEKYLCENERTYD